MSYYLLIMIGAIAAAIITVLVSGLYQYEQQIEKLRSDWIDAFRNEVASLASSIHTIIILWEAKSATHPHSQGKLKFSELEFERFRCTNKELYEMAFKNCTAVRLHLHFISAETNKELGVDLDKAIIQLLKDLLGNTQECGKNNRELLMYIINLANQIIENKVSKIKSKQDSRKSWTSWIIGILVALIILMVILLACFDKETSNADMLSKALDVKTEIQKTNTLYEKLSKQINENNSNLKDDIANLKKEALYFKQLPPKQPAIPKKNPKAR